MSKSRNAAVKFNEFNSGFQGSLTSRSPLHIQEHSQRACGDSRDVTCWRHHLLWTETICRARTVVAGGWLKRLGYNRYWYLQFSNCTLVFQVLLTDEQIEKLSQDLQHLTQPDLVVSSSFTPPRIFTCLYQSLLNCTDGFIERGLVLSTTIQPCWINLNVLHGL